MTEELKPCPFCGSGNVGLHHFSDGFLDTVMVECNDCGVCVHSKDYELDEKDAIELWNRRVKQLPKCPRCGKEIQFMIAFMPWGVYDASCGCSDCNLILQSHGRYSPTLPDEELDKVRQFEREMMMKAFEESMRNHGITDKESAERYLQECRDGICSGVKE